MTTQDLRSEATEYFDSRRLAWDAICAEKNARADAYWAAAAAGFERLQKLNVRLAEVEHACSDIAHGVTDVISAAQSLGLCYHKSAGKRIVLPHDREVLL